MPRLPVNRYGRCGTPIDDMPLALTDQHKNAVRLTCVNRLAAEAGLTAGHTLADARAILPDLVTLPAESDRDAAFLRALQRWAERYSPWTSCDGADGLLLNSTGCAHLFGGEEETQRLAIQGLGDLGLEAQAGIADTRGAARAVARFGSPTSGSIIPPGQTKPALAPYPVEALFAEEKTLHDLKRLGLKSIGDLYPLKSADLARRFGFGLLRAYEKMLGTASDPVIPAAPLPSFAARISFPDPVGLQDDVEEALRRLTTQLCTRLVEHGHGVRGLRLHFQRADKTDTDLEIGLARPSQEVSQILRQFRLKLGKVDAGLGIDRMRLAATATEPYRPIQQHFAGAEEKDSLNDLISTIGNRLGFDRVLRVEPVSSHLPQRAFRFAPAIHETASSAWNGRTRRPLIMVDLEPVEITAPDRPPKGFRWRGQDYATARAHGPERIGHEWWKGNESGAIRDYWSIETKEGARLWLSTRPDRKPSQWEVAGVFP